MRSASTSARSWASERVRTRTRSVRKRMSWYIRPRSGAIDHVRSPDDPRARQPAQPKSYARPVPERANRTNSEGVTAHVGAGARTGGGRGRGPAAHVAGRVIGGRISGADGRGRVQVGGVAVAVGAQRPAAQAAQVVVGEAVGVGGRSQGPRGEGSAAGRIPGGAGPGQAIQVVVAEGLVVASATDARAGSGDVAGGAEAALLLEEDARVDAAVELDVGGPEQEVEGGAGGVDLVTQLGRGDVLRCPARALVGGIGEDVGGGGTCCRRRRTWSGRCSWRRPPPAASQRSRPPRLGRSPLRSPLSP